MITAKGLKPTSQSQQSQPTREDYAEPEQQKRRIVPLAFLLLLTGFAAYLKSFLPTKMEAREAQQASKHDDADQSDPPSDDVVAAAAEEVQEDTRSQQNVVPGRPTKWSRSGSHTTMTTIQHTVLPRLNLRLRSRFVSRPARSAIRSGPATIIAHPPHQVRPRVGAVAEEAAAAVVAATTGRHPSASRIHPLSRRRIPFATGRRGPMDRCTCRTWSVARYL